MSMVINTNVPALNAQNNLATTQNAVSTALTRLSSGLRINSAKDDAAGLAITNRMSAQINGLNQASRNANDGISLAQTAEGAMGEITNMLLRMKTLAVEAANENYTASDRAAIQLEVDELVSEIDRIAETTSFNNKKILNGTSGSMSFHVGANSGETITVDGVNVKANALGSQAGITQSVSGKISLANGAVGTGTRGISEAAVTTTIATGDILVKIDGMSSVNITAVAFGGDITSTTTANLTNVNHSEYGDGMAKDIAARINDIRKMQLNDTTAGVEGTYLENVYASAKTVFKASDITDGQSFGGAATDVNDLDYNYVGAGALSNGQLQINGVDIGAVTFDAKDASGTLTTAINAKSDITGVKASISDSGELVLTAEDGRDIIVTTGTDAGTSDEVANLLFAAGGTTVNGSDQSNDWGTGGFNSLRVTGQVTISAMDTITVSGTAGGVIEAGFAAGTIEKDNAQAVGSIANADVTTIEAANVLMDAIDSAMETVDTARAKLGAVQNRLDSTISNLQSISENVSASRSRTMDADFAEETSNLTRAQILQQAGIAMLSQANQLPQQVLSLLQG